jgi:hypothetical protein
MKTIIALRHMRRMNCFMRINQLAFKNTKTTLLLMERGSINPTWKSLLMLRIMRLRYTIAHKDHVVLASMSYLGRLTIFAHSFSLLKKDLKLGEKDRIFTKSSYQLMDLISKYIQWVQIMLMQRPASVPH